MSEKLTMAQIAGELGVSRNAVSAVINRRARKLGLAEATEQRIREYLDRRGYVQSQSAVALRNGGRQQQTTGILYCGNFLHFHYLIQSLELLTDRLKQESGRVEIVGVDPDGIHEAIREQVSKGIRRLIWIHANWPEKEIEHAEKLFPLLNRLERVIIYNYDFIPSFFDEKYLAHGIDLVGFDREGSYREVAKIFRAAGHRKIAVGEIPFADSGELPCQSRLRKFFSLSGCEVFGLHPGPAVVDTAETHRQMIANLITHHQVHGIRCAFIRNDFQAAAVIAGLLRAGVRVPEDIAIIGFGNMTASEFLPVPLTTFEHPVREMCRRTLELLDEPATQPGRRFCFKNKLILRDSHNMAEKAIN